MHMISHQDIGMNLTLVALTGDLQAVEKQPVVMIMEENGTPVIAALNEMVGLPR